MRFILNFLLAGVVFFPSVVLGWTPDVDFVSKFRVEPVFYLDVDEGKTIYATFWDGTIRALTVDGTELMVIEKKTKDGKRVLKRPAGIYIYEGKLYVADEALGSIVVFDKQGNYLASYGTSGSAPKEFRQPQSVFVDKDIIYVADRGNRRIQMLGPNGVYIGEFGNRGMRKTWLVDPADVKVLPDGTYAVADNRGRDIKLYGHDRQLQDVAERVGFPLSIAVVEDGFLVSDNKFIRVTRHDMKGIFTYSFGAEGGGLGQFRSIGGIAVTDDGTLFAADEKGEYIHIYTLKNTSGPGPSRSVPPTSVVWKKNIPVELGRILWDPANDTIYGIEQESNAVVLLRDDLVRKKISFEKWQPTGLALDPDGALWVSDGENDRIVKLDEDGAVVQEVGTPGSGLGRLDGPSDIVINRDGIIFVADRNNRRVQMYRTDGVFQNVLGRGGTSSFFDDPVALAMDAEGILYVLDSKRREVLMFSADGRILNELGKNDLGEYIMEEPVDVAVTVQEVYVLDAGLSQVLVFDRQGQYMRRFGAPGKENGDLDDPVSLDTDGAMEVLVSDTGNSRLQKLRTIHTPRPPQDLAAIEAPNSIGLTWTQVIGVFVEKYFIYRSENGDGPFAKIAEVTDESYIDYGLSSGKKYYYQVTAVAREGNEGLRSIILEAVPK